MSTQDIDKETLKADLVKHLKEQADANSEAVALESHEAQATETDEVDVDDISHEDEAGDLHAMYQETDDRQQELITTAENRKGDCRARRRGELRRRGLPGGRRRERVRITRP